MANDLIDLAALETWLGRSPGCTEGQLDAAVGTARRYCRWHIGGTRTETLTLDGSGDTVLSLPTLNVTDVASVSVDGVELDPDTYEWSAAGILRRSTPWPDGFRSVDVELTHGHPIEDIPDIVAVVAQLAARIPSAATPGGTVIEESIDDYRYRLADGTASGITLTAVEMITLDAYRIGLAP